MPISPHRPCRTEHSLSPTMIVPAHPHVAFAILRGVPLMPARPYDYEAVNERVTKWDWAR